MGALRGTAGRVRSQEALLGRRSASASTRAHLRRIRRPLALRATPPPKPSNTRRKRQRHRYRLRFEHRYPRHRRQAHAALLRNPKRTSRWPIARARSLCRWRAPEVELGIVRRWRISRQPSYSHRTATQRHNQVHCPSAVRQSAGIQFTKEARTFVRASLVCLTRSLASVRAGWRHWIARRLSRRRGRRTFATAKPRVAIAVDRVN